MAKYNIDDYDSLINKYAEQYKLPPQLIKQVIKTESSGNPSAASGTGPVGLMQISKALAKDYGYSNDDRLDPEKNIAMGARYLADNYNHFGGDISKTLLGYNQGTAGAEKQLKSGAIAPEGLKYMNNKNFSDFTQAQDAQNIANPAKTLNTGAERANQYSPALLNRDVAANAPNQAEAQTQQVTSGINTMQQLNQQRELQRQQMREQADKQHAELTGKSQDTGQALQQAGIALVSAFFGNKDREQKSVVQSAPHSVGSNYSTATQDQLRQMQRFNTPSAFRSTNLFGG